MMCPVFPLVWMMDPHDATPYIIMTARMAGIYSPAQVKGEGYMRNSSICAIACRCEQLMPNACMLMVSTNHRPNREAPWKNRDIKAL